MSGLCQPSSPHINFKMTQKIRELNDEQFLHTLLSNKRSFEMSSNLSKILTKQKKVLKSYVFIKVPFPEYRCRVFAVPELSLSFEKDDVFQQEVENNYKLERVYYKEYHSQLGDLNIIKIRFFKKQNKTPRHLIISSISH